MPLDVSPTSEDHRATTFELFFDLVYVFAATQVSRFMLHDHSSVGVFRGLLLLALLWWTWSAYSWLGNQARADVGVVRLGMCGAMAAIFVVALTIPDAWPGEADHLASPLTLVVAYLVVRVLHLAIYAAAAGGDRGLLRQLAITVAPLLVGGCLLVLGVALGGEAQTWMFAAALVADWSGTYLTSRHGGWRLRSPGHWAERHGLFLIIVIGESVVALGVGAGDLPVSARLVGAAVLGVAVATALWWLYFDVTAVAAERRLGSLSADERAEVARDAYTYGHFPIVAGVVIAAVGLEGVIAHVDSGHELGLFSAAMLCGGVSLYLAGHVAFTARLFGSWSRPRSAAAVVAVLLVPVTSTMAPLSAMALVLIALLAVIVWELTRSGDLRTHS